MKKLLFQTTLFLLLCSCISKIEKTPVDYVNNRIGNISHLLVPTYPTTHLPNSMLRMIPTHNEFTTDRMEGLALNSPSHRQGHSLLLLPYRGDVKDFDGNLKYRYDHEKSTPYNYSVYLDDFSVGVDFAPAAKSAIYRFRFEDSDRRLILLKANGKGEIDIKDGALCGYDNFAGIKHYFYLEFDAQPIQVDSLSHSLVFAEFPESEDVVNVRYGISYIGVEQAKRNLYNEINDFNLEKLASQARDKWNDVLGKIKIEGGTEDQKTTFYTALYRAHERMINISEDGKYFSAYDGKVHEDNGVDFWVDDWVWDTYLALHPLQVLLNPEAQEQKLASYIRMYEQSGWIPTFPCVFGDAHCMNGNHAAGVFADALNKGLRFDVEKAFEGMKHTVMTESMIPWYRGPKTALDDFYHENGWFPALHPGEKEEFTEVGPFEQRQAAAVTTAASYDDWCIAQLAKHLGKDEDYRFFQDRSYMSLTKRLISSIRRIKMGSL